MRNMRVLGIIPARGGSKGIPRKNIRLLGGKPLLQYSAETARGARRLTRVILSTEDEEIATVGRACGLDVPFLRPEELARDDTPTLPVLQHAVGTLEASGESYDAICLLQPTSPFRRAEDVDACIAYMDDPIIDAVVSVREVPVEYNPHWVYFMASDGQLRLSTGADAPTPRRQSLPPAFHRDGSIYVVKRSVLMEENSLYGKRLIGYQSGSAICANLDTMQDWVQAERLVSKWRS